MYQVEQHIVRNVLKHIGITYMPLFGSKLAALHIHDNEKVYNADLHLIPYDGKIDFDRVAREIAESGYEGSIMLEVSRKSSHYYDNLSANEYFSHATHAANKLRNTIINYKKS